MITIMIVEPPSNLLTSGCSRPLRGNKCQKLALEIAINAAPQMIENISKSD